MDSSVPDEIQEVRQSKNMHGRLLTTPVIINQLIVIWSDDASSPKLSLALFICQQKAPKVLDVI